MIRAFGTAGFAATVVIVLVAFSGPRGAFKGAAYVIDGDTIAIGSQRFRLNGVAAPESYEPGGRAATKWMQQYLAGRVVTCLPNGERSYNRLVAICRVGGRDVGAMIIRAGLARDCPRFSGGRYLADERAARAQGRDLSRRYILPGYCRR